MYYFEAHFYDIHQDKDFREDVFFDLTPIDFDDLNGKTPRAFAWTIAIDKAIGIAKEKSEQLYNQDYFVTLVGIELLGC